MTNKSIPRDMTPDMTARAIQNLIDRMNRVEAAVAHLKPVADPLGTSLDAAIATMQRATQELASRLSQSNA